MDKNFLYNIYINQYAIIENNLNIDIIDASIFCFIDAFSKKSKVKTTIYEGKVYYYISWKELVRQMPILGISSRSGIFKRIKNLIDADLIESHPDNGTTGGLTFYAFGAKSEVLFFGYSKPSGSVYESDNVGTNGNTPCVQMETPPVYNRTHYNSISNNNINNNTNISICENSKNEFSPSEQSNNLLDVSLNEKKEKKQKAQKPKSYDGDEPKSYDPSNYVDGIGDGELRDLVGVFYKKNPDKYETAMYKEFLAYWTELPIAGKNKKERWRHQKFFNLSGRLATWAGNLKKAFPAKQFTQPVDHIQKRCPEADNYDF